MFTLLVIFIWYIAIDVSSKMNFMSRPELLTQLHFAGVQAISFFTIAHTRRKIDLDT